MKWQVIVMTLIALCAGCGDAKGDKKDGGKEEPAVESECADGVDNDEDGDTDCDDSDCADAFECNWPDTLDHETLMAFNGRTIECKIVGVPFDYDIDDCTTKFTAALTHDPDDTSCEPCDRVYNGPLTWLTDSCSEMLGESGPKPDTTQYGVAFTSETERKLYVNDPTAGWTEAVDLTLEGGEWVNITEAPIKQDIDECNNGEQYLGDLTVTVTFTDG